MDDDARGDDRPGPPDEPGAANEPGATDGPGATDRPGPVDGANLPAGTGGPDDPDRGPDPGPGASASASVELLAAALRRDAADLDVYAQVLGGSLAEALPAGSVELERKRRSMADRMAGREGRVERAEISLGDERLALTMARGRLVPEILKVVRGVVLSRTQVEMEEWARRLAEAIAARARSDARARAALERLVVGGE
ncbi:hypothetical protein [Streptomyces sp. 8L]|uniref:hypothetical protein n=1 Tax=Streptomyces sp. 8L TaxID=2877242 RepID=UPI001CD1B57C|nr:hypothetical protein [Streptomyces sp. 8L]MCA1222161.1 hypothetical protein [Streptomyces sp. 8L]